MKHLSRSAGALAAAQIGGQLIGLIMLVIVSRRIGPLYLGAYAFSLSVVSYVGLATTVGLPVLGMREVSHSDSDKHLVLIETASARLILSLILSGVLILLAPWIASSHASRVLLPILALKLLTDALTFDWYLQGTGHHSMVAKSRFSGQLIYAAALLPLVASGLTGALHYAIANIIGFAATATIIVFLVIRNVGPPFGRTDIRALARRVKRSTPFFWWTALTQIYYSTDLILITYLAGDRNAGLYAAASKLPLSVIAVASLWFTVAMPETARLHIAAQTNAIRQQTRVAATTALVAGLPFILLGPVFATDIAKRLFGAQFVGSGPALAILSISVAVSFAQIVVTSVVMGAGRERPFVRIMSFGAAANIALNLLLIPFFGIIGAAVATLIAESIVLLAGISQMRHIIGRLDIRWRAVIEAGLLTITAAIVALFLQDEVGFISAASATIVIYTIVIVVRTLLEPRWLNAWLGNLPS